MKEGKQSRAEGRSIPRSLARVVAYLERAEQYVVTTHDIAELLDAKVGDKKVQRATAGLVKHQWLRRLPIRGAYEFLPARTGTLIRGDPFLELRILRVSEPNFRMQVALAAAAFIRGYASRKPQRPPILVDKTQKVRPRLRDAFRVIRTKPERIFGADDVRGLPTSTASRLFIECVLYWRYAGDLRQRDHWLSEAARDVDIRWLRHHAADVGPSTRARVGYLLERFGGTELGRSYGPAPRRSVAILGDRNARGRFIAQWGVYDTIGVAEQ